MGRRFVVGIGVAEYDEPALNLKAVPSDVARVTAFFANHPNVQHEHVLTELTDSPSNETIRKTLSRWLKKQGPDDVVVVYIAAHGEVEAETAYVQGRDSPREQLAGEAIDGEELGRIIGQAPPHNVLMIVDTCVAGRLGSAIQRAAEDVADRLNTREPQRKWAQAVVCSTFGRDPAHDGRFANAFQKAVSEERYTGTSSAWISIDSLMTGLNSELRELGGSQVADRKAWGPSPAELIPNPNFGSRPSSDLVSDHELAAHFEPSARGATPGEAGWYFTGREQELARIVAWLNDPRQDGDDRGLLVVTGSPGCGKSALVSRVIVLSNEELRNRVPKWRDLPPETLPPLGAVHAVVWCHNKTLEQVVAGIGKRIGVTARTCEELLAAVGDRQVTIVVDALDEAIEGHARRIATRLLQPMARVPGIKILLGTRPHPVGFKPAGDPTATTSLLEHLGVPLAGCIILDQVDNRVADMRDYVMARLIAAAEADRKTPYSAQPDVARAVADKIVEAAGSSFLVAAVTAKALAAREEMIDPTDSDLELPTEAGSAMMTYINRLPEPDVIHDVLRPLAWAQGAGLPWGPLWARLANALAPVTTASAGERDYDDDAIARVLDRAGDLVVEAIDAGEPVYRLFHEALAEHLRSETDPTTAHAAIATTILDTGVRAPFDNSHSYALAYLAHHRSAAPDQQDRLDRLSTNPLWERAKRRRFGNSVSFMSDVDRYIDAAPREETRDIVPLVCASTVYSRMMSTAPPRVIAVFARAGQSPRAELMAGNITFAVDRCLAFCLLAPVYARERDICAAQRCLTEAQRAIASVDRTHSSMVWYWVTEAAVASEFDGLAATASRHALNAAIDPFDPPEEFQWERPHALFWGAKALVAVSDDEGLARVRMTFRETSAGLFRNQNLQAASAAGDQEWLRGALQAYRDGARYPSIIRDGNLTLALASAGMTDEFNKLLETIAEQGGSAGEPDSQKRFCWALAIAGRFDEALAHLDHIGDAEERAKALAHIVDLAARDSRKDVLNASVKRAAGDIDTSRWRIRTILIPALYDAGEQDHALSVAEELALLDITLSATHTLSFPPLGHRRRLRTEIKPLRDETLAEEITALVNGGEIDNAVERLSKIQIPRFRARARGAIARAHPDPHHRMLSWIDAIVQARYVSQRFVNSIIDMGEEVIDATAPLVDLSKLEPRVRSLDADWTLASFTEQYETLREMLPAGPERTRRMDKLMAVARSKIGAVEWSMPFVADLLRSGSPGERAFALGLMHASPDLAEFGLIVETISNSASAFEQYHTLQVALAMVGRLSDEQASQLNGVIAEERNTKFGSDPARHLLATQIERAIGAR